MLTRQRMTPPRRAQRLADPLASPPRVAIRALPRGTRGLGWYPRILVPAGLSSPIQTGAAKLHKGELHASARITKRMKSALRAPRSPMPLSRAPCPITMTTVASARKNKHTIIFNPQNSSTAAVGAAQRPRPRVGRRRSRSPLANSIKQFIQQFHARPFKTITQ